MAENICTIPINDVFGPKDGCPICRLRDMLENNSVLYITGAAMMEPDVRVKTNETGFCLKHYRQMGQLGKKLPNALIMETHLDEIAKNLLPENVRGKPDKKQLIKLKKLEDTCFVCDRIEWGMKHMFETIFASYQNDAEFKALYNSQPYICLPHYTQLMEAALNKGVASKNLPEFYKDTAALAGGYLRELKADVSHLCKMYDYRSRGEDWGNSKDSLERAVSFLTGESE